MAHIKPTKNLETWASNFSRYRRGGFQALFDMLTIQDDEGRFLIAFAEGWIIEELVLVTTPDFSRWVYASGRDNWITVFDLEQDRERTVRKVYVMDD